MISIKIEMEHYVTEAPNGTVHVQNVIGGLPGQHHVHTPASFKRWCETTHPKIAETAKGECGCGLTPGQVREYDGGVWFNDRFLGPVERHVYRRADGGWETSVWKDGKLLGTRPATDEEMGGGTSGPEKPTTGAVSPDASAPSGQFDGILKTVDDLRGLVADEVWDMVHDGLIRLSNKVNDLGSVVSRKRWLGIHEAVEKLYDAYHDDFKTPRRPRKAEMLEALDTIERRVKS